MPIASTVASPEGQNREGEIVERRVNAADTALRSRVSDKKTTLQAIHPPQRKQQETSQVKAVKVLSPKTPKTPKSILNRQKQIAVSIRLSLHFAHDVLLMAHFFGGILAVVLAGYGIGAGFAAYSKGNKFLWANAGVAVSLLGVLLHSYNTIVRPMDYLINAGLSYVTAVQRAIITAQESEGKNPLTLPILNPSHPIAYLRKSYVNYLMHYVRLGLFLPPLLLFAASLVVLGTAVFHNKWYIWAIGACFATTSSLWFIGVWTLYLWLKARTRRMSSQIKAFFSEFLTKPPAQKQELADADVLHPHVE